MDNSNCFSNKLNEQQLLTLLVDIAKDIEKSKPKPRPLIDLTPTNISSILHEELFNDWNEYEILESISSIVIFNPHKQKIKWNKWEINLVKKHGYSEDMKELIEQQSISKNIKKAINNLINKY
jgi:hypothetical protein